MHIYTKLANDEVMRDITICWAVSEKFVNKHETREFYMLEKITYGVRGLRLSII